MDTRSLDLYEERINAITHGLGVVLALIAAPYLLMKANAYGKVNTILAVSVFLFGMLMCYLSSTMFHALKESNRKRLWLIADHISIFFMIGGTYTPLVHKYVDDSIAMPFLRLDIYHILRVPGVDDVVHHRTHLGYHAHPHFLVGDWWRTGLHGRCYLL
jgi:predicted membrane channel-forming protein YqfA (hemolysin III family)